MAREQFTQRPFYVGTDGDGAAHYWSSYAQAILVIDGDGDTERFELADLPIDTLGQWCEHVRNEREWATEPRVGGSLVGDLVRGIEA
ncbi:hypothetical protein ACFQL1_14955 [Halomicroarcula sp. GCM10025709]|uniref:hypothetical protein n=1 Tax=Haloarcula TaxID=2237 RepID=UPI0036105F2C